MKILIIFNREPYDKTDVTWNGLRLARKLMENGNEIRIFLMNDAVDMARDGCKPPMQGPRARLRSRPRRQLRRSNSRPTPGARSRSRPRPGS